MNLIKFVINGIYNVFKGIGSITLFPQNHIEIKSDYESLKSGWEKVGEDFYKVLGEYKKKK